jgi:hypothetical protein
MERQWTILQGCTELRALLFDDKLLSDIQDGINSFENMFFAQLPNVLVSLGLDLGLRVNKKVCRDGLGYFEIVKVKSDRVDIYLADSLPIVSEWRQIIGS